MIENDYFIDNPIINNDLFSEKKNELSHFTDKEVITLLKKVSNTNVQRLAKYFERLGENSNEYETFRKVLHNVCMKLLDIYGSKILTLIYQLPFFTENDGADNLHNISLNLDMDDVNFDGYKIPFGDDYIYLGIERIIREDFHGNRTSDKGSISLMQKRKDGFFSLLCRIKNDGTIDDYFINNLEFNIYSVINNKNIELYSGSFDVRCRVCGRELTSPDSIYYGIGPECARNYG